MAKLSKKIRKRAGKMVRSESVADVLEKVIAAALIAAAVKFAESRTADQLTRKAAKLIVGAGRGGKTKSRRRKG